MSDAVVRVQEIRALIAAHKRWDIVFGIVGLLALMVGVLTFVTLFIQMVIDGAPRLSWDFFTFFPSRKPDQAGILSAWVGSTLVMLVTAAAAVPLGVGAGVYLEEYAPKNWMTDLIEINVTNLAGVPSIVYGLLALGLFVYEFGFGQSILTAGLTLALLILPVVIVATREAIRSIPAVIREGAYALGASKWQTTADHILPYARGGILTGVIIGMSRAIGETAPVITIGALTFIAFLPPAPVTTEFPFLSFEWIMSPFTVMPIQMFNWTSRPEAAFHRNAAAAGLVLVVMTLSMNALAIYLRYRLRKNLKW
ncbi:MAG: phosphate ABC transporter, permease protein PstA [Betaproteobacteria bacterium RIFCSPLOWO2_12_FULL_62_13]|nr:MAG: phosphate ABC transporter, permease protein PstA [Betaproteobacteria bacterium RIFCSPLOWO2_12_FULL_62_13]